MGILKGIVALWKIASWLRSEKKKMESDIDGYLTQERALEWRLNAEKVFCALECGKMERLPSPIKWFFKHTTADERVGSFGIWLLKSKKLEEADNALNQPLYRAH